MRGCPNPQRSLLAIVDPGSGRPGTIWEVADAALERLSPEFDCMYTRVGRASVPPERLLAHDADRSLFDEVVWAADEKGLLSDEHFSVDGILIEAAASLKSFRLKEGLPPPADDDPGNPSVDFRGNHRCNETHVSTTDPDARLLRKGQGKKAQLALLGHALKENRHGLLMDFTVSQATDTAERDAVPELLDGLRERGYRPRTLGADHGYDTKVVYKTCGRDGSVGGR